VAGIAKSLLLGKLCESYHVFGLPALITCLKQSDCETVLLEGT